MSVTQFVNISKLPLNLLPHSICVRAVLQAQAATAGYATVNVSDFRVY